VAETLTTQIETICTASKVSGDWSVAVVPANPAEGGLSAAHDPQRIMAAASIAKLGITYSVLERNIPLDKVIQLQPEDRLPEPDIVRYFRDGFTLDVGTALERMLTNSSNTCARMLVRALGGPQNVNEIVAAQYPHTQLQAIQHPDYSIDGPHARFAYGTTTAPEAAGLMRELLQDSYVGRMLSHSTYDYALRRQLFPKDNLNMPILPRGARTYRQIAKIAGGHLPDAAARYLLQHTTPQGQTRFPNKEGSMTDEKDPQQRVRHDIAHIGNFIVAACSNNYGEDLPVGPLHPAHQTHGRIGKAVYNYSHAQ